MKAKIRNRITLNSLLILIILITTTAFTSILSLQLTRGIGLLLKNNNALKSIRDSLDNTHKYLETYLTFKSSESLKEYIKWSSTLESVTQSLNSRIYTDKLLLMERNLYWILTHYLKTAANAVNAKRGRNIPVYTAEFEKATTLVESAHAILDTLHLENMNRSLDAFDFFKEKFGKVVFMNFTLIAIAFVLSIIIIYRYSFAITVPITLLANSARELEMGNFIHAIPQYAHDDEIGTLYTAFVKMQKSIKEAFDAIQKKSELEQQILVQKMEMLEFQHKLKDSELLALQTQINPHFLYNTLSAGWQLALTEHDEKTAEFLQKLAEFIRYALKPANRLVLVSEEVDCAKKYVWLLEARFGNRFNFTFAIDEKAFCYEVPALILQPLIENAISHGLKEKEQEGSVYIAVEMKNNIIIFSVQDNGIGMDKDEQHRILSLAEPEKGIGLTNVIRRIELATSGKGNVSIDSNIGEGTTITISIPIEETQ